MSTMVPHAPERKDPDASQSSLDLEPAWTVVAALRDTYDRSPNDVDTWDVLEAAAPCILQSAADVLSSRAELESNGSRDFGRGYMHAVRVLRDIAAGR